MNDNKLSEAEIFAKTLKLRNLFKELNQLTWSIREAEQRFSVQTEGAGLLYLYKEFIKQLIQLAEEAKKYE